MFPRQAHPWKVHCCCWFNLTVVGRTRMSPSARPRGSTGSNSYSVATLARNALSTMEISLAPSSAHRYEANWNRFAAFLPTLDRKRHYLPGSPNTIKYVCSISRRKGKHPVPLVLTCRSLQKGTKLVSTLSPQRIICFKDC